MNVLLFHLNPEKLKILSFTVESETGLTVAFASTLDQAVGHLLEAAPIDMMIVGECEQAPMLFKYLLSINSKIPLILVTEGETKQIQLGSEIQLLAQISEAHAIHDIPRYIKKQLEARGERAPAVDDAYCRIAVELLIHVAPLASDVFVRLSNVKLVKIFNAGATFTETDLRRIWGIKRIDHLYIPKAATGEFVKKLEHKLGTIAEAAKEGDPELLETSMLVQGAIQDLSHKMGFTPEVQALTQLHIKTTLKAIGKSPKLSRILAMSAMKGVNYTSRHSLMVAHIACCIASKLGWPSDATFHKLILASITHDLTLANPEHADIQTKKDLIAKKDQLTAEEYNAVETHPFAASQLVNKLTEIPGDVYLIVLQHHERPDGSGFPRGMRAGDIAPLAAVFITAHELVDMFFELGSNFDMERFWETRFSSYANGTFKKIFKMFTGKPDAPVDPAA